MDFKQKCLGYEEDVNNTLENCLAIKYPEIIYQAMRYSVFAGGKRVRPILILGSCKAVGGDTKKALIFAAAMEMIHTYSLIHDDLPAMDNDDFRRGKPTNHKVYGEAMAILAGDGLLNLAYEIMSKAVADGLSLPFAKAMNVISACAGVNGMVGGQTADIMADNKDIAIDELTYIHENKTAALIKACTTAGAILGGAKEDLTEKMEAAGYYLGMAFQIKDDILDVTSTKETLGKPINSDCKNNKATYVSLKGLETAKKDYMVMSERAIEIFEGIGDDFLVTYARYLMAREN